VINLLLLWICLCDFETVVALFVIVWEIVCWANFCCVIIV